MDWRSSIFLEHVHSRTPIDVCIPSQLTRTLCTCSGTDPLQRLWRNIGSSFPRCRTQMPKMQIIQYQTDTGRLYFFLPPLEDCWDWWGDCWLNHEFQRMTKLFDSREIEDCFKRRGVFFFFWDIEAEGLSGIMFSTKNKPSCVQIIS